MNKLNNSFKIFLDNIIKPLIKKEASTLYKMEPVENSYSSVKMARTYTYYSNNSPSESIKILYKNKTLLDTTWEGTDSGALNFSNSIKETKEIKNLPSFWTDSITIPKSGYDSSFIIINSGLLYVINDCETVVNGYDVSGLNIKKYLGNTGAGGYGFNDYERLAFLCQSDYQTFKIILINKQALFSGDISEIAKAIENRYEYDLDTAKLGEEYAEFRNFDNQFTSHYVMTSYSHGLLYLVRQIGKFSSTNYTSSYYNNYPYCYYVATIIDCTKVPDGEEGNAGDLNISVVERVLTELGNFGDAKQYISDFDVAKILISDNNSYYSNCAGTATVFLGNSECYFCQFPMQKNSGEVTTAVPTFTKRESTALKSSVRAFTECFYSYSYRNCQHIYLLQDYDRNLYKYDSTSGSITLYKLASDMFREQPELTPEYYSYGIEKLTDDYYLCNGRLTKDFVVFYPFTDNFYRAARTDDGRIIYNGKLYTYDFDKLLCISTSSKNTLARDIGVPAPGGYWYETLSVFSKVYYTQANMPSDGSITLAIEQSKKNNY